MTAPDRCAACDKALGPIARRGVLDVPGGVSTRMQVSLVVEIRAGDDAGERALELGHRLAEVAEQLGATFADVLLVDDMENEEEGTA